MVRPLAKLDFNVIADHYYPILMRRAEIMCRERGGNQTTAEEAVQETMIAAWSKRDQVQPGHFHAWINQILNNKISDAYRPGRFKDRYNYMKRLPDNFDVMGSEDIETTMDITDAITKLPETFREVAKMTVLEGLEQEEIAIKLKLPLGTVQSRQHRSKMILKNKLKDLHNG